MKRLNEQFDPNFVLQANKLSKINRLLHGVLPVECRNHVEVANIRQKNLVLLTDSPVWATRLRQLAPRILNYIQENQSRFDACINASASDKSQIIHHIKVSTRYHANNTGKPYSPSRKHRSRPRISKKTAELLHQSANSIQDQKLKTALLKIASHGSTTQPGQNCCDKWEAE